MNNEPKNLDDLQYQNELVNQRVLERYEFPLTHPILKSLWEVEAERVEAAEEARRVA